MPTHPDLFGAAPADGAHWPQGFRHIAGALTPGDQASLLADIHAVIAAAPLYQPAMPRSGHPLSVHMTNCGPLGWYTDKAGGYRYLAAHPETGRAWPPIPAALMTLWQRYAGWPYPPEACLVNLYDGKAKMGLHVDWDEEATEAPVVSVSLGAEAAFRLGVATRRGPTARMVLRSGDVVVLGGAARRCYHGVDRIYPGTSPLPGLENRINLTLRRVTRPSDHTHTD